MRYSNRRWLDRGWLTLPLLIFLTACNAVLTPQPTPTPTALVAGEARPDATFTPAPDIVLTPIPPTPTLTPSPTPTPVIHIVESGDTLFGVALEYGITLNALLSANGLDASQYLRIGQALIIPMPLSNGPTDAELAAPGGSFLLPTPTPLPLSTAGIALYTTPVGGIWCMGEVVNTTDTPITNLQVRAVLIAADGAALASGVALAAADYLPPGARAPFAVLFRDPPGGVVDARVTILRGETVGAITAGFMPLDVTDTVGGFSGPQYRVSGRLSNPQSVAVRRIATVVTLYDAEERVIGYRQSLLPPEVVLEGGQSREFQILLTPQGFDEPHAFAVLAWAVRP